MATGVKTGGGSRKGRPNKATSAKTRAIAASGLTPLEYMLSVMRDEKATREMRLDASRYAAPYVHPRLNAIEHSGPKGAAITIEFLSADGRL
jgi:hypothetical protein